MSKTLKEQLSELVHSQWSGWMEYLFSKCECKEDGTVVIPKWAVERWKRQLITPYEYLNESEKDSDRNETNKFICVFIDFLISEDILKNKEIKPHIKPSHGPCCTCQTCGYYHDECVCSNNDLLNKIYN